MATSVEKDQRSMAQWLGNVPDKEAVKNFVHGSGIDLLDLRFDINELKTALSDLRQTTDFTAAAEADSFGALAVTRRPGVEVPTANDLSGLYWLRADDRYQEEPREEAVNEAAFTELVPTFVGTYFEHVHQELTARFPIGRMRLLWKDLYNCNSWHRDPEPRIHVPIVSNPGSLFVVNNHCTHLPADGSVYFTDTRGYHTALNGGLMERVHLVAAVPWCPTE
ncbi:MAG: hypothetical protein OSA06_00895 [Acidimicrobiales bacterium]|nr:hypothetical protein [Acidimicrobiales bacterium]